MFKINMIQTNKEWVKEIIIVIRDISICDRNDNVTNNKIPHSKLTLQLCYVIREIIT